MSNKLPLIDATHQPQFAVPGDMYNARVQQQQHLMIELNTIYAQKNHDYGDSFHESYEEDGLIMSKIRLGDKYKRFCSLIKGEQKVADESIRDTLMDLADYALMTVMEMDREKAAEASVVKE